MVIKTRSNKGNAMAYLSTIYYLQFYFAEKANLTRVHGH